MSERNTLTIDQHKKKWLSNAILGCFLLLVVTTAFLSDAFKTQVKGHNEFIEQSLVFNNKELDDISNVSFKNKSGEFIFERQNNSDPLPTGNDQPINWHMTSPKAISTNSILMGKLFSSLKMIKTKKLLIDDHATNSNFSLDKPTAILTLTDSNQKSIVLSVGIMNTIDNSTYMRISGKSGIYHVEAPSISLENITLASLIESSIFDLNVKKITSFKIFKTGAPTPQFDVHKKNEVWLNSLEKPLDESRLEVLLEDFIVLKSGHILDEQSEAQKKQIQKLISPPDFTVKIDTSENQSFTYLISSLTKSLQDVPLNDEAHFLIIEKHAPIAYVVKKEAMALFELKNDSLKSLEIAPKN